MTRHELTLSKQGKTPPGCESRSWVALASLSIAATLAFSLSGCFFRDSEPPADQEITVGACNPSPCARIKVAQVPELPESISAAVRERVATHVAEVLYAPLDETASEFSRESLKAQVEARQKEYVTQGLSSAPLEWMLERTATVLFSNDDILTVDVTNTGYFGGAHGFDERTLLCFDLHDGKRLTLAEIVNDQSKGILQEVAEAEFRRVRQIPVDRSLEDEGFFVAPGEPFKVTDNFGVVADGILLHYNPYEIGPYVMGETKVLLPREVIAPLLKDGTLRVAHLFDSPESPR